MPKKKGLQYTPEDTDTSLEKELSNKLGFNEKGFTRSISTIKDIVTDGEISLFRCTQLLDLNPYRKAENTHSGHICISFNVPETIDLFFLTYKDGKHKNIYPKDNNIEEDLYFQKIKPILENNLPD